MAEDDGEEDLPLNEHDDVTHWIANLQKERDDLEWSGNFIRSDFLQKLIDSATVSRDNGETYYPLF